jgi:hypothetical protein
MKVAMADVSSLQQAVNTALCVLALAIFFLRWPFYEICLLVFSVPIALRLFFNALHLPPRSGSAWDGPKARLRNSLFAFGVWAVMLFFIALAMWSLTDGLALNFDVRLALKWNFLILPFYIGVKEFLFPNPRDLGFTNTLYGDLTLATWWKSIKRRFNRHPT